jgi:hypothetical protein
MLLVYSFLNATGVLKVQIMVKIQHMSQIQPKGILERLSSKHTFTPVRTLMAGALAFCGWHRLLWWVRDNACQEG